MHDLCHFTGGDLDVSSTGDLRTASDSTRTKQRILRRLLTNPGDYVFHPEYGAGLGKKIGEAVRPGEWKALISGQMLLEEAVASHPPPVVKLMRIEGGVSVSVSYTEVMSGAGETLHFDITR
ncbi:phage tail protein [Pantoea anthophila]|uniref:phage tail protein n=1 Tax=Pantoea anthophila TaxID=470931 RepID=UPI003325F78D